MGSFRAAGAARWRRVRVAAARAVVLGEPFPYWSALTIVQRLVEGLGAERIIWGTDWPYLGVQPYPELIRAIRTAPFLGPGEADQILGGNALRFLERSAL